MGHDLSGAPRQERPCGDLEVGVKVGKYNRLKEHFPFGAFLEGATPPSGRHIPYVSPQDLDALGVRLNGMRVLLVRAPCLPPSPYRLDELLAMPPLSLILLANMLRAHGARVEFCDLCLSRKRRSNAAAGACSELIPRQEWGAHLAGRPGARVQGLLEHLIAEIRPRRAEVIGLSVESGNDMLLSLCLAREIGKRHSIPVVIGGREIRLSDPLIDRCPEARIIAGEGEVPLLLFLDALLGRRPLASVPGLNRVEGGARLSHSSVLHDLDVRPTFDLTGVPLEGYSYDILGEGTGPIVPYQFNHGCPFFCGFCNSFSRRIYRLRSPEKIVADLAHVVRRFGVRRFYFINHLLNCDMRHLRELVERLEAAQLKILWGDCGRLAGMDAEMLRRLRGVGASKIVWGLDCASPRLARLMKKSSDPALAVEVLAAAHRAGIRNAVNLIIGMPHETAGDIEAAVRMVKKIKPFVQQFNINPYRFDANSPLARQPQVFGLRPSPEGPGQEPWEPKGALRKARALEALRTIERAVNG